MEHTEEKQKKSYSIIQNRFLLRSLWNMRRTSKGDTHDGRAEQSYILRVHELQQHTQLMFQLNTAIAQLPWIGHQNALQCFYFGSRHTALQLSGKCVMDLFVKLAFRQNFVILFASSHRHILFCQWLLSEFGLLDGCTKKNNQNTFEQTADQT